MYYFCVIIVQSKKMLRNPGMDKTQAKSVKHIPTYCYNCVSGPDFMTVKVVDGVATEVEPNFAAAGMC